MPSRRALYELLRSRLTDRSGSATVEFVIWIPFFLMILGMVTDVSLLINVRSRMFDAAREASRSVALGISDTLEAEAFALNRFSGMDMTADVSIVDGYVTTTVTTTFSEAMLFGDDFLFNNGLLPEQQLLAVYTMVVEPSVLAAMEAEEEE